LRVVLGGTAVREWEVGELIEVALLSEGLRCKAAYRKHANERGCEEVWRGVDKFCFHDFPFLVVVKRVLFMLVFLASIDLLTSPL
jgi:hypothetical protein